MEELFMNICMDLWSGDASISYEMFVNEVNQYIQNLRSHMGIEAHLREKELGIIDATGMTWKELDKNCQKQIDQYQNLLDYLAKDENWTL